MGTPRNVVYQFEGFFATLDRAVLAEAAAITQLDLEHNYLGRWTVNLEEAEWIRKGRAILEIVDGELIVTEEVIPDETGDQ